YPPTARHDRGAKQDDDNRGQFAMNNAADNSQLSFAHDRQLSRLDRLAPGKEFDRRYDGQKCDCDKDRKFRHEGVTVKIVGGAFLKEKHPQQSNHQKKSRRHAQYSVNDWQPSSDSHRQVLADEYKFDRKRRNQSKRRNVVEKGKKGRHWMFLPFSFRDALFPRKFGNSSFRRFALPRVIFRGERTMKSDLGSQTGKLSCLRAGISTCLLRNIANARAIRRRVECGMI